MELHKVQISNFNLSDYDEAISFWSSTDGVTLNESDSLEAITQFLNRNPHLSFILRSDNGEVIGTLLCGHNGRAAQIYHLTVASDMRGQGLGKLLVKKCFMQLEKEKIPRCNIFVYHSNKEGNNFWLNTDWHDPIDWRVLQKQVY